MSEFGIALAFNLAILFIIFMSYNNKKTIINNLDDELLDIEVSNYIIKYPIHYNHRDFVRKIHRECVIRRDGDVYRMVHRKYIANEYQLARANSYERIIREYNAGIEPGIPDESIKLYGE